MDDESMTIDVGREATLRDVCVILRHQVCLSAAANHYHLCANLYFLLLVLCLQLGLHADADYSLFLRMREGGSEYFFCLPDPFPAETAEELSCKCGSLWLLNA